ncbi:MAG TPA: hypothetical protein PKG77_20545 [Phycisphaerae bacterium]|nr:hypothetical protein [Phycisphaerae bacterium]HQL74302.1 hypothetical protein [Phycisphaerae bacterium]
MADTVKKLTPRDILRIVFRRWRLFFGGALLFAIGVLIAGHYLPVKYTGTTRFQRRTDPSQIAGPGGGSGPENWDSRKDTLRWDLSGPNALEQAAADLELTVGMPHGSDGQLTDQGQVLKQELIGQLSRAVRVSWDVRTPAVDLISVSVTHEDPRLARMLPDQLVKNYINRVGEQIISSLRSSKDFLDIQVKGAQELLQQYEEKRMKFERDNPYAMPQEPGFFLRSIEDAKTQVEALQRQQELAKMKLRMLEGAINPPPTTQPAATVEDMPTTQPSLLAGVAAPAAGQPTTQPANPLAMPGLGKPSQVSLKPNPNFLALINERDGLKENLTRSLLVMKPAHPKIKDLETRIKQTEERIQRMVENNEQYVPEYIYPTDVNPVTKLMLEQEISYNDAQIQRLETKLGKFQAAEQNYETIKQEYERILNQIKAQENELSSWTKRLEDVRLALQGEIAKRRNHLEAIRLAERQIRPSDPSLSKILMGALIGGLAFGAVLVFLAHLMDRSIGTPEDAKQFGVPVQGIIGEIITRQRRRNLRLRRWLLAPVVILLVFAILGGSVFSITLWLREPDEYNRFAAARIEYVQDQVVSRVMRLIDRF